METCFVFSRQGKLQFRPPFEEIRARFYREMKRFIGIPSQFRGVTETGDDPAATGQVVFPLMIDRNADSFNVIYSKAEDLFRFAFCLAYISAWCLFECQLKRIIVYTFLKWLNIILFPAFLHYLANKSEISFDFNNDIQFKLFLVYMSDYK